MQKERQYVANKVHDLLSSEYDYQKILLEHGKGGQSCVNKFIAGVSNLQLFQRGCLRADSTSIAFIDFVFAAKSIARTVPIEVAISRV